MRHGCDIDPPRIFENLTLIDKKDLARRLGVCTRTINNLMVEGLPYQQITPRLIRFNLSEVAAWLQKRRSP